MDGFEFRATRRRGGMRPQTTGSASGDYPANSERLITSDELLLYGLRSVSRPTGELRPLTSKDQPC